jgi:hypothetical protein
MLAIQMNLASFKRISSMFTHQAQKFNCPTSRSEAKIKLKVNISNFEDSKVRPGAFETSLRKKKCEIVGFDLQ